MIPGRPQAQDRPRTGEIRGEEDANQPLVHAHRAARRALAAGSVDTGPAYRTHPLQPLRAVPRPGPHREGPHRHPDHPGHLQDTHRRGPHQLRDGPRRPGPGREAQGHRRRVHRRGGEHLPARPALVDRAGAGVLRRVGLPGAQDGRQAGLRRLHDGRQEQGEDLRREGNRRHLLRCRRGRRGEDRTGRDRRVPEEPAGLRQARRAHPQGRAAGRPARHRQDAAGEGRRRRGGRAVLLHLRLRVRRDVRRRRRGAGTRSVRAGTPARAGHHLHRRVGRARARARRLPRGRRA